jgi:hypothetical protein
MAELAQILCPIDGLQVASRNATGGHLANLRSNSIREHDTFTFDSSVTCSNGHTWHFTGRIDMRVSPDTGL